MANMINCPYCGKLTDPKLESCPHCGGFLQRKQPASRGRAESGKTQTCPNCHAVVQEGDIICVACGTNLLTGHKIAEEAPKKKRQIRISPAWAIGAVVALIAVVLVGFVFWVLSADPVSQAVERAKQGDVAGATRILRDYTADHPNDVRAFTELGRLQFRTDPFAAADSYETVFRLQPNNTRAAMLVVLSLASSNDPNSRRRQVAALKSVVAADPKNKEAWFLLALAQGASGNIGDQIDALKTVISLGGEPAAREFLGVAYALQGQYDPAEQELQQALVERPEDADTQAALGFVQEMRGNTDDAIARLKPVAAKTSVEREALVELGILLIRTGDFASAVPYLSQAVNQYADSEAARFYYSVALHALGRDDEALQLSEGLAREGGKFAAQAAVQAADIYLARGNSDNARKTLETAQQLGGSGVVLYTLQGRLNALSGDTAGARDSFRKAIQTDPNYAPAYLESGLLYVRQQEFKDAITDLQRYVDLAGSNLEGTRVDEVKALITQLKETSGTPAAPSATPAPETTGEVS